MTTFHNCWLDIQNERLMMTYWNFFRFIINCTIVVGVGHIIRNFTHQRKYFPNGKQIVTMTANWMYDATLYTLNSKNYKKVVMAVIVIIIQIILCCKIKKWYDRKTALSTNKESDAISYLNNSKRRGKDGVTQNMDIATFNENSTCDEY